MIGTGSVMNIGKKVIQLIRQKCLLKHGSASLKQGQARNATQRQQIQRYIHSGQLIYRYRMYLRELKNANQLSYIQHIKALKQIGAGNCMQMGLLSFLILKEIVPPGILVEQRMYRENNQYSLQDHLCVSIKPLHSLYDKNTLVIDPWPSFQLINPQVVFSQDHFLSHVPYKILRQYRQPEEGNKVYKSFEQFKQTDFNLKQLQNIQKLIDNKNDRLDDFDWDYVKYYCKSFSTSFEQVMEKQQYQEQYKKNKFDIKHVSKKKKNI